MISHAIQDRAAKAIQNITSIQPAPKNPGNFKFLPFDLNDIQSVKAAAATFAAQESKLDVLWNNAGLGGNRVEPGAKTSQGLEAMVGMHCVATLLFTELLRPQLQAAAADSSQPKGSVRVLWTSSIVADQGSPPNGIEFDLLDTGTSDRVRNYAVSKVGSWMLSREMARRYSSQGIMSVALNPGNVKTDSYGGTPAAQMFILNRMLHEPKYAAYTELYAGLSPEITFKHNGAYIIPWGRIRSDADCPRKDIIKAMTPEDEGGLGYSQKLWEWCEKQWQPFV